MRRINAELSFIRMGKPDFAVWLPFASIYIELLKKEIYRKNILKNYNFGVKINKFL